MKAFIFAALLGLVACTTSTVKMSPEETESFLTANADLNQARAEGLKVRSQFCDSKTGPCWKVECIGESCWKTELDAPPAGLFEKPTEMPTLAKTQCGSAKEPTAVRRKACFEYVSYLGRVESQEGIRESVRALDLMCNIDGVSCQKNYAQFGSGRLRIDGENRTQVKSGQYKIYTYRSAGTKTVVVYDYSVLQ